MPIRPVGNKLVVGSEPIYKGIRILTPSKPAQMDRYLLIGDVVEPKEDDGWLAQADKPDETPTSPVSDQGKTAESPEITALKTKRGQAIHYYRIAMYEGAYTWLKEIDQTEWGKSDFDTQFFLSMSATEREDFDLETAFASAERAVTIAKTKEEKQLSSNRLGDLKEYYSAVTLKLDEESPLTRGRIFFWDTGGLINPDKKKLFEKIKKNWKEKAVEIPEEGLTIYLPFGEYTANRIPFSIKPCKKDEVCKVSETIIMLQPAEEPAGEKFNWGGWMVFLGALGFLAAGAIAATTNTQGSDILKPSGKKKE